MIGLLTVTVPRGCTLLGYISIETMQLAIVATALPTPPRDAPYRELVRACVLVTPAV